MKKIVITQRLIENDSYFEIREALDINFASMFKKLNFLPIVLPIEIDFKNYFKEFDISGVILTGGNDLSSLNESELSKKRDSFELELIDFCYKNGIAIFGICRGLQIIAKYFDMSLKKVENHVGRHDIEIDNSSKYYKLLKDIKNVNSYHNYSINENFFNRDFLITAKSTDGEIEAIEHREKKVFAQMWHSERENPFIESELNLISEFFK